MEISDLPTAGGVQHPAAAMLAEDPETLTQTRPPSSSRPLPPLPPEADDEPSAPETQPSFDLANGVGTVVKAVRRSLSLGPTEPTAETDAPPTSATSANEAVIGETPDPTDGALAGPQMDTTVPLNTRRASLSDEAQRLLSLAKNSIGLNRTASADEGGLGDADDLDDGDGDEDSEDELDFEMDDEKTTAGSSPAGGSPTNRASVAKRLDGVSNGVNLVCAPIIPKEKAIDGFDPEDDMASVWAEAEGLWPTKSGQAIRLTPPNFFGARSSESLFFELNGRDPMLRCEQCEENTQLAFTEVCSVRLVSGTTRKREDRCSDVSIFVALACTATSERNADSRPVVPSSVRCSAYHRNDLAGATTRTT